METSLWGWQKKIKIYFHDVYGCGKRRYGGAEETINSLLCQPISAKEWTVQENDRNKRIVK